MQASDLSESSLLAYTAVPAMAGAPNGQVVRWGCHGVRLCLCSSVRADAESLD